VLRLLAAAQLLLRHQSMNATQMNIIPALARQ
jgi:hypothetical protein